MPEPTDEFDAIPRGFAGSRVHNNDFNAAATHEADGLIIRGIDDITDDNTRDAELGDCARAHKAGLKSCVHRRVVAVNHTACIAQGRERGLPGPGLLAHVLVSKYCDHLPLYRQNVIYAREGVEIDRSTLAEWVGHMAFLLNPLVEAIAQHVRSGAAIHADDTPVRVLDPGRGKARTGRLWVAVRDERPWGSCVPPAAFYLYSPDRKAKRAEALLGDCRGFLHADAYSGFNSLYKPVNGMARLSEVACWAHARRYIFDVHAKTKSPAAYLQKIGELFAIEDDISGRPPEERLAVRTALSVPLLAALKTEYEKTLGSVGNGTFAKALRYALTLWEALTRYTTDGRLDICNNAAERAIWPLALGWKNWPFCGSDSGGERAAKMYTLIETAKLNDIDPEAYLRIVIARIADHQTKSIDQLMPWNIVL